MSLFIVFGILLTAIAIGLVVTPLLRRTEAGSAPIMATVMAVALPAAVMLLYVSVSNYNWNAPAESADAAPDATPDAPEMSAAIARLEERLQREPGDLEGWLLLGRAYTQMRQFPDARRAYLAAIQIDAGSEAKLGLSETEILMDRANLAGEAGQRVEEVLAIEPDNPRALFYGGMVAMSRNDTELMKARWQRLLQMSPPPNVRQIIEEQLAALGAVVAPTADDAAGGGGISVRISVADELVSRIKPGAMLFLVAREPGVPGPPVAVVRKRAEDLPMQVEISDADAMLPGRTVSTLDRVQLIARIANGGDPTAQPGDISGERVLDSEEARNDSVSLHMDRIVE